MQKKVLLIACIFAWATSAAQQYSFVHYTPKDGLVNSRVRKSFQDSKARMYFLTFGGLSMYDGIRFRNYTVQNGLASDLVNDMLEMGDDSIWIACNAPALNYLRYGKIKTFRTADGFCPTINKLVRGKDGSVYAMADEGLFIFEQNRFVQLPFPAKFLLDAIEWKDFLLITSDNVLNASSQVNIYLFDKKERQVHTESKNRLVSFLCLANDREVYLTDNKGVLHMLDTVALLERRIKYRPPPERYRNILPSISYMYVDRKKNFWFYSLNKKIIRIDAAGSRKEFSMAHGMSSNSPSEIFEDKEGSVWIAMHDSGVDKLVNDHVEAYDKFNGVSIDNLYTDSLMDAVYLYNRADRRILVVKGEQIDEYRHDPKMVPGTFVVLAGKTYLSDGHNLFLTDRQKPGEKKLVHKDTVETSFGNMYPGRSGIIAICGLSYITLFHTTDHTACHFPIKSYIDQVSFDKENRLWAASRGGELYVLKPNPAGSGCMQLLKDADKNYPDISARSITVDHSGNVWVGTRYDGLYCFQFDDRLAIRSFQHYTTKDGLSDNFITHLTGDMENNIWASTASGLDNIRFFNNEVSIQNITRGSNIYEYILRTFIGKNGIAWSCTADGNLIKIGKDNSIPSFTPGLLISELKIGNTVADSLLHLSSFSYRQNSLSISVAAPSFYDEQQIKYSYLLQGSGNDQWSEPSNNSTFNFVTLNPGKYTLKIKAAFPGGRYADQILDYAFVIHPPWWQTWWFRIGMVILGIGLLWTGIIAYYRRKLERQRIRLEKQQAVEKERTRIATDIHDDLGSGLSRIRYLGEMVKLKTLQQQNLMPDIEKISVLSDEMVDKMNEIVWALNEKNDSLEAIISYTRSFAVEYLSNNNIGCKVTLPDEIPARIIKGETRRNIFLSVKECLHNIVKHSGADEAIITIAAGDHLVIRIHDNGAGIDWDRVRPFSNGILNIKKRMRDAGGSVDFKNEKGAKVELTIPLL